MRVQLGIVCAASVLFSVCSRPVLAQGKVTEYGPKAGTRNTTAAATTDLTAYLQVLEQKVGGAGPKKFIGQVTVSFTVDKSGAVSNIKLTKSSGMPQIDAAATSAVKSSAPFSALPSGAGNSADVQVIFAGTSQSSTCHAIRLH
ncbi:MAG TPA: energy transducer TonB [Planktothrix sp.]|jgi:TonB family protein